MSDSPDEIEIREFLETVFGHLPIGVVWMHAGSLHANDRATRLLGLARSPGNAIASPASGCHDRRVGGLTLSETTLVDSLTAEPRRSIRLGLVREDGARVEVAVRKFPLRIPFIERDCTVGLLEEIEPRGLSRASWQPLIAALVDEVHLTLDRLRANISAALQSLPDHLQAFEENLAAVDHNLVIIDRLVARFAESAMEAASAET